MFVSAKKQEIINEDLNEVNDEVDVSTKKVFPIIQHGCNLIEGHSSNETIYVAVATSNILNPAPQINLIIKPACSNLKSSTNEISISKVKSIQQCLESNKYSKEEILKIDKLLDSTLQVLTKKRKINEV